MIGLWKEVSVDIARLMSNGHAADNLEPADCNLTSEICLEPEAFRYA